MKLGSLVRLLSEDEIVYDDAAFEWDHSLIFPTREDARDMRVTGGTSLEAGTIGTVLSFDSNFVKVCTPMGIGWSRSHYWCVVN